MCLLMQSSYSVSVLFNKLCSQWQAGNICKAASGLTLNRLSKLCKTQWNKCVRKMMHSNRWIKWKLSKCFIQLIYLHPIQFQAILRVSCCHLWSHWFLSKTVYKRWNFWTIHLRLQCLEGGACTSCTSSNTQWGQYWTKPSHHCITKFQIMTVGQTKSLIFCIITRFVYDYNMLHRKLKITWMELSNSDNRMRSYGRGPRGVLGCSCGWPCYCTWVINFAWCSQETEEGLVLQDRTGSEEEAGKDDLNVSCPDQMMETHYSWLVLENLLQHLSNTEFP